MGWSTEEFLASILQKMPGAGYFNDTQRTQKQIEADAAASRGWDRIAAGQLPRPFSPGDFTDKRWKAPTDDEPDTPSAGPVDWGALKQGVVDPAMRAAKAVGNAFAPAVAPFMQSQPPSQSPAQDIKPWQAAMERLNPAVATSGGQNVGPVFYDTSSVINVSKKGPNGENILDGTAIRHPNPVRSPYLGMSDPLWQQRQQLTLEELLGQARSSAAFGDEDSAHVTANFAAPILGRAHINANAPVQAAHAGLLGAQALDLPEKRRIEQEQVDMMTDPNNVKGQTVLRSQLIKSGLITPQEAEARGWMPTAPGRVQGPGEKLATMNPVAAKAVQDAKTPADVATALVATLGHDFVSKNPDFVNGVIKSKFPNADLGYEFRKGWLSDPKNNQFMRETLADRLAK